MGFFFEIEGLIFIMLMSFFKYPPEKWNYTIQ